eukprot:CAMPEP_0195087524 /NCGR_PEP_ID=MMETSP0448-20130528/27341_1 /TAXON_ID=66468 /ORGANISM="Heterocapsa triquestra, Strain CCMP 448" /LENGTH=52 /DNA_ID=CAMNT_0040121101 /DNA_START=108 /DNA_END=266 /DNA_ORIENTATION=-
MQHKVPVAVLAHERATAVTLARVRGAAVFGPLRAEHAVMDFTGCVAVAADAL